MNKTAADYLIAIKEILPDKLTWTSKKNNNILLIIYLYMLEDKKMHSLVVHCLASGILISHKFLLEKTNKINFINKYDINGVPSLDNQIVFEFSKIASHEELLKSFDAAIKCAKLLVFS